jgi:hypothetical protein
MRPLVVGDVLGLDWEGWSKILVVGAAITLAVGSVLQALQELREYNDVLRESGWADAFSQVVSLTALGAVPTVGLLLSVREMKKLFAQLRKVSEWNTKAKKSNPAQWRRADTRSARLGIG